MLLRKTHIVDAEYTPSKVPAYRGNPLIEALPPLSSFAQLTNALEHFPPKPDAAMRKQDEWTRYQAVSNLRDIIVATPEYKRASIQLHTLLRNTYIARNAADKTEEIRCIAIANRKLGDDLKLPFDWKSTASGHMFISSTGTGKTTFIDAFLLRLAQVIRHKEYQGEELGRAQVVYLKISIPPDGTLKAFCLNFFQAVDKLLNTNYLKQAYAAKTVANMTLLMGKVATSISLGLLIVDEFQNLKIAKTEQCVIVFNMFVQMIEDYGISVVTLCTPAIQKLLAAKLAITRKLMGNTTYFPLMAAGSNEWKHFSEAVWPFCYTERKPPLTPEISAAWHRASGGNTAFAINAYKLAQEYAITEESSVDEVSFEMVLNTSFAALKPAIDALARGRPSELEAFEDLICDAESRALIAAFMPHAVYDMPATAPLNPTDREEDSDSSAKEADKAIRDAGEFDEISETAKPVKPKKAASPRSTKKQQAPDSATSPLPLRPVDADLA